MGVKQPGSEAEKTVSSFSSESLGMWQRKWGDREEVTSKHLFLVVLWWQNLVVLYVPREAGRWVKVTAVLSI